MTAEDALEQKLLPHLVRGDYFSCSFTPPSNVTPPSLAGAAFRFAIGTVPGSPIVTVTGTLSAYGQVTNPSGTTLQVVMKHAATRLLTADTDHAWQLYVTPSGSEEVTWAAGTLFVKEGAGEVAT